MFMADDPGEPGRDVAAPGVRGATLVCLEQASLQEIFCLIGRPGQSKTQAIQAWHHRRDGCLEVLSGDELDSGLFSGVLTAVIKGGLCRLGGRGLVVWQRPGARMRPCLRYPHANPGD